MDRDGFWRLVEASSVDVDCEAHAERLSATLARLAPEEIIRFDQRFWQLLAESYRWDLWGVAYQLNGGCSDDGFVYFRCWLLAQGRATWEAALREPDSAADHPFVAARSGPVQEWAILECEPMLLVTPNAYRTRVGAELPADGRTPQPAAPLGEPWDFEDADEARRRLPRAWGAYGSNPRGRAGLARQRTATRAAKRNWRGQHLGHRGVPQPVQAEPGQRPRRLEAVQGAVAGVLGGAVLQALVHADRRDHQDGVDE